MTAGSVRAALLGTLVGDALGAPYEGARPVPWSQATNRIDTALAAQPLRYTDDTQLAFALAAHLAEAPEVDPPRLAEEILARYEDDRGYGPGMVRLVDRWRRGVPVEAAAGTVFGEGSFGNGAAMRIAPLGAFHAAADDRLEAAAVRSARLTHAHPLGVDGAVAQARAVAIAADHHTFTADELDAVAAAARSDELIAGLSAAADRARRWRTGDRPDPGTLADELGTAAIAQRSVPAALWCAAVADDVPEAVALALSLGGDVDTIAAMAAAVCAVTDGGAGIPDAWLAAIEPGAVAEAEALADRLRPRAQDRPSTS